MPSWSHRLLFGSSLALAVGCGSADPGVQGGAEAPEAGAARPKSRRSPRPEIDPTQIVFSLRHREEEFDACAGEPRASGHVQLRWRVTKSGAVRDVKVLSSTLPDQALTDCVRDKVKELKFTRSSASRTAHWTFVFGLERGAHADEIASKGRKKTKAEPGLSIDEESPGFLEPGRIESVVEAGFRLYGHCYRDGLSRTPGLGGAVRLKFVIAPTGVVEDVRDGGSDLPDQRVIDCVAQGIFALQFPKPERGSVHVLYRVVFDAS
jgi:hypothetical protein